MDSIATRIDAAAVEIGKRFGAGSGVKFFRAPGRVDVMGSHTDYNQGFILASTIDRDIIAAARPRGDGALNFFSLNLGHEVKTKIKDLKYDKAHGWANYPKGVIKELLAKGLPVKGMDLVFHGNVPVGGNLSSSAALEAATCEAVLGSIGASLDKWEKVHLCRAAENNFLGMPCGIMDQFAVIMGRADAVMLLDCQSLEFEPVPIVLGDAIFIVLNSGQGRELVASEYSRRVEECKQAVAALAAKRPGVTSLRDATLAEAEAAKSAMTDVVYRRARHVLSENLRVRAAGEAARVGDVKALGRIMEEGFVSCRDDYENSSDKLNILHDLAAALPGVYGARVCGAGWGGCLLALVQAQGAGKMAEELLARYAEKTGMKGDAWLVKPSAGAGPLSL